MGERNRRDFLAASALVVPTILAARCATARAPSDLAPRQASESRGRPLRVGVIGCGGRGGGAAFDALRASPDTRLVALGDVFGDRVQGVAAGLAKEFGTRGEVPDSARFSGFDSYRMVLATDCDVVILTTAPGFRPAHFAAAVDAGKHVFFEKPVAVDPTGVRTVIEASERAAARKLCVVAGTQRRHERCYLQAMAMIRDGAIGQPVAARVYWNQGGLWSKEPDPARSDIENQVRNWLYHTWLSGDHVVEQHAHNIDVMNWAFDALPVRCTATGGRQVRTQPVYGAINDHFSIHYVFDGGPAGERLGASMCRQQDGTDGAVEEVIIGTEGTMRLSSGSARCTGRVKWAFEGPNPNPYLQEHIDLQEAIRGHAPYVNEGRRIAESTMTAIMGRMAAYTGKDLSWDVALNDPMDLVPKDPRPGPGPVERVAMPGQEPAASAKPA
jgi:predicted dehydrogenase